MSATPSTIVRSTGTNSPGGYLRIFNSCWERIAGYFLRRAAIKSLRELDERALRDIGLTRSEIEAAVRGLVSVPNQERT
jgi:uncharacterized protein YjiS (DUF1127 family)